MTKISDENHILRHVTPKNLDTNEQTEAPKILGEAFIADPRHQGRVSYNWRDFFSGTINQQLNVVRSQFRRSVRKSHVFAEINVGSALEVLKDQFPGLEVEIIHDPLPIDDNFSQPDDSHSVMANIPNDTDVLAEAIGDWLSKLVTNVYPVIESKAD